MPQTSCKLLSSDAKNFIFLMFSLHIATLKTLESLKLNINLEQVQTSTSSIKSTPKIVSMVIQLSRSLYFPYEHSISSRQGKHCVKLKLEKWNRQTERNKITSQYFSTEQKRRLGRCIKTNLFPQFNSPLGEISQASHWKNLTSSSYGNSICGTTEKNVERKKECPVHFLQPKIATTIFST